MKTYNCVKFLVIIAIAPLTAGTVGCGRTYFYQHVSKCGNGELEPGEECDDGNEDDNDPCLHNCKLNVCGDGYKLTGYEECDDGNNVDGDGCDANCLIEEHYCGDGFLDWELGEDCDDGNNVNGDGCTFDCRIEDLCGNGVLDFGEECDDGNFSNEDACLAWCQPARCGDGFLWAGVEQCDDGNNIAGDGCSPSCFLEGVTCGNGILEPGEECDDGNLSNNDGCLANCTAARCGDTFLWSGVEQCDDGNLLNGDGCSGACTFEGAICGNGILEPGEQCDDGNFNNSDACLNSCRIATCGDGFIRAGVEMCDDGNTLSGDGCSSSCELEVEICGNGIVEAGEECDDGNSSNNDGCLQNCRLASCGDGWIWFGVEQCDDGNNVPGDGCDMFCRFEGPVCGNGVIEPGEECDDGNFSNSDACLNTCRNASCGDGLVWLGVEQCDDGNNVPGDGCSPICTLEGSVCGNGVLEPGEQCDDGNFSNNDACLATCQNASCGDNFLWFGVEQCDDGNTFPGDGCDMFCQFETAVCGNGILEPGEECDDGNLSNNDACLNNCQNAECGDSRIWFGVEQCDDGNTVPGDGCDENCRIESVSCGNGVIEPGEECDDGNFSNNDACLNTCRNATCGDNFRWFGVEQCDDGNNLPGDGCSPFCTVETGSCGNGVIDPGEQCDDGNFNNGDACLNTCLNASCGDGFLWNGVEECDDGNNVPGDGCSPFCTSEGAFCGNGILEPGEQCDDGNTNNNDGCLNSCQNASCGDGYIWVMQEQCDDGNNTNGDGCDANCNTESPTCVPDWAYLDCGGTDFWTTSPGSGSTDNIDSYPCTGQNLSGPEYTYTFEAQTTGQVTVNLSNTDPGQNLDLLVLGYGGGLCEASNCLQFGNNQVSWNAVAGETYFILVEGRNGSQGNYSVDMVCAQCGNGVADPGEQCDDGNSNNNDACLNTCENASCGDGFLWTGVEQCDDGNNTNGDGCSATCQLETATCGNGIPEPGEQCDDGNASNNDGCLSNCQLASCGDGFLWNGVEQCDDGNTIPGDGCNANCQLEVAVCGNGIPEPGEQCDDGNLSNNDACLNTCRTAACGDGQLWFGVEQCDDGNTNPGDGCSPTCTLETAVCGNGIPEPGEECDDGNPSNNDACLSNCQNAECGDGWVWFGVEQCDDGNTTSGDGCSASCQIESATCGNGIPEPGEQCDDGNASNNDACLSGCINASCGDGFLWFGVEQCDDGNTTGGDGCSPTCQFETAVCGNGIPEPGEQCDDGNASNNDACLTSCRNAACGDGFVWGGVEQCDDGNTVSGDGCDANCRTESATCGNSIPEPGEDCDDGNLTNSDACLNTCVAASCGDGYIWINQEECDDGNTVSGDGCDANCQLENPTCVPDWAYLFCNSGDTWSTGAGGATNTIDGYPCTGRDESGPEYTYTFTAPDSGQVTVEFTDMDPGIDLDLFILSYGGGICAPENCISFGDNQVTWNAVAGNTYFILVDGTNGDVGGYSVNMTCPGCGNGIPEPGEQCDDGNFDNGDACLSTCINATCGDGFVWAGVEQCDDGNTTPGDGCDANCQFENPVCQPDWTLTCGSSDVYSTNNPGATDALDTYSCSGLVFDGPEYTYTFTSPDDQQVTVNLTGAPNALDLLVLTDSGGLCDPTNCIAYGNSQVVFAASAGQTYYIVVDGRNGTAGNYTVGLTCANCGNGLIEAGEDCDDGPGNETRYGLTAWQTTGFTMQSKPVERWMNATSFYGYTSASAHTGYEAVGRSVIFLYRDRSTATLSLFTVHGIDQNTSGQFQPTAEVEFYFRNLPPGTTLNRGDEPNEFSQISPTEYYGSFWFQANTDGAVISDIAFPAGWTIEIEPIWNYGLTEWIFVDDNDQLHTLDMTVPLYITADANPVSCREDCTVPQCGDDIMDPGETCDDGNNTPGDGCASDCMSMP